MIRPPTPPSQPQTDLLSRKLWTVDQELMAWIAVGIGLWVTFALAPAPLSQQGAEIWVWPLGWAAFAWVRSSRTGSRAWLAHHSVGCLTLFLPWLNSLSSRSTPVLDWGENQMAGALVLFLPLWLVEARKPSCLSARCFFAALSLCCLGRLWQLHSRGAWLAVGLAMAATWVLGSNRPLSSFAGPVSKLGFAALLVTLLMPAAAHRSMNFLLFEHQLKGATLEAALTGRPAIWWRSLIAGSDLPFGIGLGSSPKVLAELYPGEIPDPSHAHQQVLQFGLELGWLGLGSWLALCLICCRRPAALLSARWGSVHPSAPAPEPAAILGAWLGFGVFGLTDCLPPAHLSSFGIWTLLALSAATPFCAGATGAETSAETSAETGRARHEKHLRFSGRKVGLPLLGISILLLTLGPGDLRHRSAVRALFDEDSQADRAVAEDLSSGRPSPGDLWLAGLLFERVDAAEARDEAWRRLIYLTESRVALLRFLRPSANPELARLATSVHPTDCEAWWWRAQIHPADVPGTIFSLRQGLKHCPRNAKAWLELANLLGNSGPKTRALEAFEQACLHGDPGANACWRGGHLAQQLGQTRRAVDLYGRSRLPQARALAYALTTRGSDCR